MKYALMKEVFYISIFHINALVIVIGINFYIWLKAQKTPLLYSFLATQGTIALWMVAKILKTVSPVESFRWSFVVVQYLAICMMEVTFFYFAHYYAKRTQPIKWVSKVLIVVATCQFLVVLTNPLHYLFYNSFDFYRDTFGPLFYIHMFIMYSVLLYGGTLCARQLKKSILNKYQFYLVSAAVLFPMVINMLYITGYLRRWLKSMGFQVTFDFTPIALAASLLLFVLAIFRYDLLDIMPLYKEQIIRRVQSAILVTDMMGYIIEANEAALELFQHFGVKENFNIIKHLKERAHANKPLLDFIEGDALESAIPIYDRYYACRKQIVTNKRGKDLGIIYTAYDITHYHQLQDNYVARNYVVRASIETLENKIDMDMELSRISARNYFARELHDILGHSMTVAIKLLEIAEISYEEDPDLCRAQLLEAVKVTGKGYQDLKGVIVDRMDAKLDLVGLKMEIQKIAKVLEVAGVHCRIWMNKEKGLISEEEHQMIKRTCQEGITNALKHGQASEVRINIRFDHGTGNCLQILNNGLHPESDVVWGSGLMGLDNRIKTLGGRMNMVEVEGWFGIQVDY